MTTRSRRFSTISGLCILGITLLLSYAYAFHHIPYIYPVGTTNTCDADVSASIDDNSVTLFGPASFVTVGNSLHDEPLAWTEFRVVKLGHQGNDPVLGDYGLSADPSRSATPSRIQAYEPFQAFPAKSVIRFHGKLALGSSDNVYHSLDEIVIENSFLTNWPHNNTIYTQVGSARFANASGNIVTLSGAQVRVTAQQ